MAKAALDVNRPYLLITEVRPELRENVESRDNPTFGAQYTLQNFGVGPADIVDYTIKAELFTSPIDDDPLINYAPADRNQLNASLVRPGEKIRSPFGLVPLTIDFIDLPDIRSDEKRIALHGQIRYRGASPTVFVTTFFWWYLYDEKTAVRALTKSLNDHT